MIEFRLRPERWGPHTLDSDKQWGDFATYHKHGTRDDKKAGIKGIPYPHTEYHAITFEEAVASEIKKCLAVGISGCLFEFRTKQSSLANDAAKD